MSFKQTMPANRPDETSGIAPLHQRAALDAKPDDATRELVHHQGNPMGSQRCRFHRNKSQLQKLSFAWRRSCIPAKASAPQRATILGQRAIFCQVTRSRIRMPRGSRRILMAPGTCRQLLANSKEKQTMTQDTFPEILAATEAMEKRTPFPR